MTPIELVLLAVWFGFGVRAGWMVCDFVFEVIASIFDAVDRWQARRALKKQVVTVINTPADGGFVRGYGAGDNVSDCLARTGKANNG